MYSTTHEPRIRFHTGLFNLSLPLVSCFNWSVACAQLSEGQVRVRVKLTRPTYLVVGLSVNMLLEYSLLSKNL